MIKLTFEYRSIEEALVALAKLGDLTPIRNSVAPVTAEEVTDKGRALKPVAAEPAAAPARRGRPRKNAEATAPAPAAPPMHAAQSPVAPATQQGPSASAPKTAAAATAGPDTAPQKGEPTAPVGQPAATPVPLEAVQHTLENLFNSKGIKVAQAVLARYGALSLTKAQPLLAKEYVAFVADCGKAERGEWDPLSGVDPVA